MLLLHMAVKQTEVTFLIIQEGAFLLYICSISFKAGVLNQKHLHAGGKDRGKMGYKRGHHAAVY